MEASALTHASRLGLLGRRSRLLRLQGDERLIALIREGQERAFETLVERYQARLLAFCRGMLGSSEDAEDVLQEVFVAAHKAILADSRAINAKPWLYRIARNRCLNHLRKPVPEGQDSMDVHPHEHGVSTAERAQKREEFRALLADVGNLPETQRTALLLREIENLAYEDIAVAMETTVPAVKSLLVRARMALADSSQGRHMTCDEVHLDLAEAAEGLRKVSGPVRAHMRDCERCRTYRDELRRTDKALGALVPAGPIAALYAALAGKLGFGGAKAGLGTTGASAGASAGAGAGASAAGGGAAAVGGAASSGGAALAGGGGLSLAGAAAASGLGGALGSKAAAGFASVALLTPGAAHVQHAPQAPVTAHAGAIERQVDTVAGPAVRGHDRAAPKAGEGESAGDSQAAAQAPATDLNAAPAPPAEPESAAEETPPATDPQVAVSGGPDTDSGTGTGTAPANPYPEPLPPPAPPPPGEVPPVEPVPVESAPAPAPDPHPAPDWQKLAP